MPPTDPYDRGKLIDACADHAWNAGNRKDLEKHGIKSEAALREKIAQVIEHQDTRAFRSQPKMDPNHPTLGEQFGREVYVLRQRNEERGRTESVTVVLNPNSNERGELRGGTVHISERDPLSRLERREIEKNGLDRAPEIVVGGRPALREQESHRQVVVYQRQEQGPRVQSETARDSGTVGSQKGPINEREATPLPQTRVTETLRAPAAVARGAGRAAMSVAASVVHGIADGLESLFAPPTPLTPEQIKEENRRSENAAKHATAAHEREVSEADYERTKQRWAEQAEKRVQERKDYERYSSGDRDRR